MSSWLRHRGPSGAICCWLLVLCLTAISSATPLLAAGIAVGSAGRLHALPSDDPAPPAAPVGSTAAAIDDLSGPAATAAFQLSSPATGHHAALHATAPRLETRSHERPAERGPPASLR